MAKSTKIKNKEKFREWLLLTKVGFFLIAAVIWGLFLLIIDILTEQKWAELKENIIYNAHGMMFDLIVLGIVLSLYEYKASKRNDIKRLKEELSDYQGWKNDEAGVRNGGIIRRLIALQENKFWLSNYSFVHAKMEHLNFHECYCSNSDFSEAHLSYSVFTKSIFIENNFSHIQGSLLTISDSSIHSCNFNDFDIQYLKINQSDIVDTIFDNLIMKSCEFKSSISNVTFSNCVFENVSFIDSRLHSVRFSNCIFLHFKLPNKFIDFEFQNVIVEQVEWNNYKNTADVKDLTEIENNFVTSPIFLFDVVSLLKKTPDPRSKGKTWVRAEINSLPNLFQFEDDYKELLLITKG